MTPRELQSLRNLGNEAEAAADEIERLRAESDSARTAFDQVHSICLDLRAERDALQRELDVLRPLAVARTGGKS